VLHMQDYKPKTSSVAVLLRSRTTKDEVPATAKRIGRLCNAHRLPGFTLAEAMLATVVLAIAAAGVLLPFTSGAKVRTEGIRRTLAANLASDLMEEIVNTDYNQIIDMYGSYTDTMAEFTDPMYANFSRGASCAWDEAQDFFILVTVWVKYNGREIVSINRLIAR
jgi:type II secretory pathway pseudopilin PulG